MRCERESNKFKQKRSNQITDKRRHNEKKNDSNGAFLQPLQIFAHLLFLYPSELVSETVMSIVPNMYYRTIICGTIMYFEYLQVKSES